MEDQGLPEKYENVIDSTREDFKTVFGPDAQIEYQPDKEGGWEWLIETTLTPAITEGGQKVRIRLADRPDTVTFDDEDKEFLCYPTTSLVVNGIDLSEKVAPILFTSRRLPMLDRENFDESHPILQQLERESGATSSKPRNKIFLSSMQSSDDLAVLFHGNGHIQTGGEAIEIHRNFKYLVKSASRGEVLPLSARDVYLRIVRDEVETDKVAVIKMRKDDLAKKLYPTDPELFRFKKALLTRLMSYVNAAGGKFKKLVDPQVINELTSMEDNK
ncbi:MAG: hypothetical protein US60_C0018G0001 [Microgenomates group bacterium GW2011_GWC1_37_8]|nr:MAG: hypothetical protein US60_C0018G0001 [Microgenomates group bacterium GW2011_GWC1_37_8]